jgi:hypothetical protein
MSKASLSKTLLKKLKTDFNKYFKELDPADKEMLEAHVARGRSGIEEGEFDEWESRTVPVARDMEYLLGKGATTRVSERQTFRSPGKIIADLERIIREGPRLPEDMTVYRGGAEGVRRRSSRWRYPVSTSLDRDVAAYFAEDWYSPFVDEIFLPEGAPGLYTAPLYDLMNQYEVFLPQGEFKLTRKNRPSMSRESLAENWDSFLKGNFTDKYKYKPPYKARGGLIHGYT